AADALEVEPGDQVLQAPGLPQVGWQDGRAERLPLGGGAAVPDPGSLDLDGSDAGQDGPLGQVAVADDLLAARPVLEVGPLVEVGGDLGLDGLGEQGAGPPAQDVGQGVVARGRWPGDGDGCRLIHGGVLLGHFGRLVVWRFTKGTPPSSTPHPQLPVIARRRVRVGRSPALLAVWPLIASWGTLGAFRGLGAGRLCPPESYVKQSTSQ